MFLLYRGILFFLCLVVLAVFALIYRQPSAIYWCWPAGLAIVFLGTYFLVRQKIPAFGLKAGYAFFSLLLLFGGIFYFLFIENIFLKGVLAASVAILLFVYLNSLFKYYYVESSWPEEKSNQLFLFLSVAIIFFLSAGCFGLSDFLNISWLYILLPFTLAILFLISRMQFSAEDMGISKFKFSLIGSLVMAELFWAIAILPAVYYFKSAVFSFVYLLTMQYFLFYRKSAVRPRNYLLIALVVIIAMIFGSQWF